MYFFTLHKEKAGYLTSDLPCSFSWRDRIHEVFQIQWMIRHEADRTYSFMYHWRRVLLIELSVFLALSLLIELIVLFFRSLKTLIVLLDFCFKVLSFICFISALKCHCFDFLRHLNFSVI